MPASKKLFLIGAALCGAIALTLLAFKLSTQERSASNTPLSAQSTESGRQISERIGVQIVAAAALPTAPLKAASPASVGLSKIQIQFHDATDWRAFALDAMKEPQNGGRFYAQHAADICSRGMNEQKADAQAGQAREVAALGTISTAQLAANERYFSRCASFAKGETLALYNQIQSESADGADPLIEARKAVRAASRLKTYDAWQVAAERLLATGDPLVLSDTSTLLDVTFRSGAGQVLSENWFDGETFYLARVGQVQRVFVRHATRRVP